MGRSQNLYKKAKRIIPGGAQLFSKKPERILPDLWPAYYKKASGCRVWDLDNKEYIDMGHMAVGTCILGYGDKDVDKAVKNAIDKGSMSTLNCPEEVELAALLCQIHPWADMVRFARTGGEAMAVAARIARAGKGKDKILYCGYHGWHDWYLAANIADDKALDGHLLKGLKPTGVPRALKGTSIPFKYNDKLGFLELIKKHKGDIAAVIMEPIRSIYPQNGFLETIRKVTEDLGITLIFDEITSGWRMCKGGAHLKFKVFPDISVFAKAMSNGYPMAAIIGKEEAMEACHDTFISSTYWTECTGPAAALAAIKKIRRENVPMHLSKIGKLAQDGWKRLAEKHALDINISGIYPLSHFSFNYKEPLVLKTLFTQLMLESGFLAQTLFYVSFAHKEKHVARYLNAVDGAFKFIKSAIKKGNAKKHLKGPVCQSGFGRLA